MRRAAGRIGRRKNPATIGEYIAACAPRARSVLRRVRATIRRAAPRAEETISYRMPTFKLHGVLVHFAAFKGHIGMYPPVRGNADLMKKLSPYAGPKRNLRFPLDQPIPYRLIGEIARLRVRQNAEKAAARRTGRSTRQRS